MDVSAAFARHRRIAFQFSGGRDSTAALYLLRPLWSRMTVYHVDTGDQFPEVRAVVDQVAQDVPIITIRTDVHALRAEHGLPSDLVPFDNTNIGRVLSGRAVKISCRMDCCWRALMGPLHQRMIEDGITLIVRGQRDDEFAGEHPIRSGFSDGQVELLYPIQDWSAAQVMDYLKEHALPVASFYAHGMKQAPECMGCTAWWDEGRAGYMREHHPQAFETYRTNIKIIRAEIDRQYSMLDDGNFQGARHG